MLADATRQIASMFFGGRCFLCRGAAARDAVLCTPCLADLPRLGDPRCPRCALPSETTALCGHCLAHPPHYDESFAALEYRFPTDVLVHALKFRGELALAPLLARFLAGEIPAGGRIDLATPVPLSAKRIRERGYNQSMEIARVLCRRSQLRLEPNLCTRVRDAPAQTDLPWAERARNVRNAFHCDRVLDGLAVAVIDDVMTTGATLDAIATALKRAGAARVVNWVVARTLPPTDL